MAEGVSNTQRAGAPAPTRDAAPPAAKSGRSRHPKAVVVVLEMWPETPILPKRSFSQRRLSMICWVSETVVICPHAI